MATKVMKWGNSLALRIPRSAAAEAGLEYGTEVEVSVEDEALVVRPRLDYAVKLRTMLGKVTKANVHREQSTGSRRGREVW